MSAYDHIFQFNYAYNSGNNSNYFKYVYETTGSYWVMPYNSGWGSSFQITVSADTWNHIAITWDKPGNKLSGYKNGTAIFTDSAHSNWPASLQPLGICRGNRDGTNHYHNANISNFSLSTQRLSAANILDLYSKSTVSYVKAGPEIIQTGDSGSITPTEETIIIFI
jgi:hypothetical protein